MVGSGFDPELDRDLELFVTGAGRGGILLALLCFRETGLRGLALGGEGRRRGLALVDGGRAGRWWVLRELVMIERMGRGSVMHLFLLVYHHSSSRPRSTIAILTHRNLQAGRSGL